MFGQQLLSDLLNSGFKVELLSKLNCGIKPQKLSLIGGNIADIVESFFRDRLILSSTVEDNNFPFAVSKDTSSLDEGHGDLFLEEEIIAFLNNLFKGWFEFFLIGKIHVGSSVYDNRVLPLFVDIDIGHACGLIFENSPLELHVGFLHLFLQTAHGIIVADLAYEMTAACQFRDCDCLVGSLPAVGGHVFLSLQGLSSSGDVLDVEEVVGISTPEYTNLFAILHYLLLQCGYIILSRECSSSNFLSFLSNVHAPFLHRGSKHRCHHPSWLHLCRGNFYSFLARYRSFLQKSMCFS